jgi:PAS domain S-box-containing protein
MPHILALVGAGLSVIALAEAKRRAEAKERKAEELSNTHLTVDSIPGMVGTMTPEGEPEFQNLKFLEFIGISSEQVKDWPSIIHPMDSERIVEAWLHSMATAAPLDVEHRCLVADGSYRWITNHGLPMFDRDGKIIRWYHLITDIDDRKRAEEALRASELTFRMIVESIPGMIVTMTGDGEIEFANQQLLRYFGKTLDELQDWAPLIHPDDRARVVNAWLRSFETGDPFEFEHRVLRADGVYRWFHSRGHPLRGNDGRIIRWNNLYTDINERKEAEEVLRSTQTRLSQATQIATISELSASIAHEINQPLAAVVANGHACLNWLAAQPPNSAKASEAAERIIRDGKEAGEVASRIRALFKRSALEKVSLDLNAVIDEVIRLLARETTKRRIAVETDLESDLPRVMGDRVQMQQLVFNLLLNGIEAMDSVSDRPGELFVRSQRESPEAILVEIRDSGVGLENPSKIFDAFFSTKEQGMGMGLAISRSIVEAHGGRLWAESGEGPGASFFFTLPADSKVSL